MWEELLIFNENFNYFTQKDLNVIVFFEVSVIINSTKNFFDILEIYMRRRKWK